MKFVISTFLGVIFLLDVIFMMGCGAAPTGSQALSSSSAASAGSQQQETPPSYTKIKMTFQGHVATAELFDNPTSRDFISLMPLTLHFKDFNETEKIADPPRKISTAGMPDGFEPRAGDLALFAPWGNISVFYKPFRYSEKLVPIGQITSGLDELKNMKGDFDMTFEVVE